MPNINTVIDVKRKVVEKAKGVATLSLHTYEVGTAYSHFAKEKEKISANTYVRTLKSLLGIIHK